MAKFNIIKSYQKLPNGRSVKMTLIDHPGASLIVPFVSEDKVICLKQYRPSIKKYIYELPCGTVDKNESPLTCAKRELIEETGFKAGKIKQLGKFYPVPGYSNEIIYIFKAEDLIPKVAKGDADEVLETFILTKKRAIEMFKKRVFVDGKTIIALAMVGWV